MVRDTQVADLLWVVRLMRLKNAPLTAEQVYLEQSSTYHYRLDVVRSTLQEIEQRGYHWDKLYPGVPDGCIVWEAPGDSHER